MAANTKVLISGLFLALCFLSLSRAATEPPSDDGAPADTVVDDVPAAVETETADTETADTENADTETADAETEDTETADSETADPETEDTETEDTEATDTETAEPETEDTEPTDTETAEPETADTETVDPETADSETADTETAEPASEETVEEPLEAAAAVTEAPAEEPEVTEVAEGPTDDEDEATPTEATADDDVTGNIAPPRELVAAPRMRGDIPNLAVEEPVTNATVTANVTDEPEQGVTDSGEEESLMSSEGSGVGDWIMCYSCNSGNETNGDQCRDPFDTEATEIPLVNCTRTNGSDTGPRCYKTVASIVDNVSEREFILLTRGCDPVSDRTGCKEDDAPSGGASIECYCEASECNGATIPELKGALVILVTFAFACLTHL